MKHGWVAPDPTDADAPRNFGMMFPCGARVASASVPTQRRHTFAVDADLLVLARKVAAGMALRRCDAAGSDRLARTPRIVVGGTGVSAGLFADNARFRRYVHAAWKARVLDMESGAVMQVAYANDVPAIVFLSLSDLAGGDARTNEMRVFMTLASVLAAAVVRAFVAALPD